MEAATRGSQLRDFFFLSSASCTHARARARAQRHGHGIRRRDRVSRSRHAPHVHGRPTKRALLASSCDPRPRDQSRPQRATNTDETAVRTLTVTAPRSIPPPARLQRATRRSASKNAPRSLRGPRPPYGGRTSARGQRRRPPSPSVPHPSVAPRPPPRRRRLCAARRQPRLTLAAGGEAAAAAAAFLSFLTKPRWTREEPAVAGVRGRNQRRADRDRSFPDERSVAPIVAASGLKSK